MTAQYILSCCSGVFGPWTVSASVWPISWSRILLNFGDDRDISYISIRIVHNYTERDTDLPFPSVRLSVHQSDTRCYCIKITKPIFSHAVNAAGSFGFLKISTKFQCDHVQNGVKYRWVGKIGDFRNILLCFRIGTR